MALSERDESQDMWVFEDGGDCLGVVPYSEATPEMLESQEAERYVRYSDLEAVANSRIVAAIATLEGTPWPLYETLSRLVVGADHLLNDHGCDAHGYEELMAARDSAKVFLSMLGIVNAEAVLG